MNPPLVTFAALAAQPQDLLPGEAFHEWTFPDGTLWTLFYRCADGYRLRFPGLADFTVSANGCHVQAFPVPGVGEATVTHLYLNQVFPLALSRQGKRVFHASAIELGDCAIAFLGVSGRGKSTLAASFALSGARFLTDDALVFERVSGGIMVQPGHPSLRLWEDSRSELVGDAAEAAPAVHYTSKARLLSGSALSFCAEPRRLQRMYFLGETRADRPRIEPMTPAEAVMALVENSFLLDIEGRDTLAGHFEQVTAMAGLPIFFRLDYPRSFAALAAVREAVRAHAGATEMPDAA